jgi:hypothetical protein
MADSKESKAKVELADLRQKFITVCEENGRLNTHLTFARLQKEILGTKVMEGLETFTSAMQAWVTAKNSTKEQSEGLYAKVKEAEEEHNKVYFPYITTNKDYLDTEEKVNKNWEIIRSLQTEITRKCKEMGISEEPDHSTNNDDDSDSGDDSA